MSNWSAKEQIPILKTIGGVNCTIGVPYMQCFAEKWPSLTACIFFINYHKSKS